jgi:thiamine pyrophosphate-dependent acetolactate synthase large subunit-like protein
MSVDRREFVAALVRAMPDALIVAGLGSPAWDLFAAGDRDESFYLWGAMGGASSMGLGLALAQPERAVVVITGDGEQLMGLGSFATIAVRKPPNLTIVVLDNGRYGETGMQASHTGGATDLAGVAKCCGIADSVTIDRAQDALRVARRAHSRTGPAVFVVKVDAREAPRVLPPRDGAYLKNRFRAKLGLPSL